MSLSSYRPRAIGAATLVLGALAAAPAHAATVDLQVKAGAAARADVGIVDIGYRGGDTQLRVTREVPADAASPILVDVPGGTTLNAIDGCAAISARRVRCAGRGALKPVAVDIEVFGLQTQVSNDRITIGPGVLPASTDASASILTGRGDDVIDLRAATRPGVVADPDIATVWEVDGHADADVLIGSPQAGDRLRGGDGDDTIKPWLTAPVGLDFVAGPGPDRVGTVQGTNVTDTRDDIAGGAGTDLLDFRGQPFQGGVVVDLALQGQAGVTTTGMEGVVGTDGRDRLDGDAGPNVIYGSGGNDDIDGQDGDDTLLGGFGDDLVRGDEGDDRLGGFNEVGTTVFFSEFNGALPEPSVGDDPFDPQPDVTPVVADGRDELFGDGGADTLHLRGDGTAEHAHCGANGFTTRTVPVGGRLMTFFSVAFDEAIVDRADVADADCELVDRPGS